MRTNYETISGKSMFYNNSYANTQKNLSEDFMSLARLLVIETEQPNKITDLVLIEQVNNMYVKYGFVLLARNYIFNIVKKKERVVLEAEETYLQYHFYNFVFYVKSFLDAVAIVLNYVYNFGFRKVVMKQMA